MQRLAHVWYDSFGRIAAVGTPIAGHRVVPVNNAGLRAIEVLVETGAIEHLHVTHRVEPATGALVALTG